MYPKTQFGSPHWNPRRPVIDHPQSPAGQVSGETPKSLDPESHRTLDCENPFGLGLVDAFGPKRHRFGGIAAELGTAAGDIGVLESEEVIGVEDFSGWGGFWNDVVAELGIWDLTIWGWD